MRQHSVQLVFGEGEALSVGAVHHQDDDLEEPQRQRVTVRERVINQTRVKYYG